MSQVCSAPPETGHADPALARRRLLLAGAWRSLASLVLVALCSAGLAAGQGGTDDTQVRLAIERAAGERLGPDALVSVELRDVRLGQTYEGLSAVPEPGGRAGAPARFALFSEGATRVRVGEATAIVTGTADAVRLTRPVSRGQSVADADVEYVRVALEGPLRASLPVTDVVGARLRRELPAGAVVAGSDLLRDPVIRSGDTVRAVVRIGGIEIGATAVAVQSGALDEVIRLTNPETRKSLRGRVTGRGEVEVLDAR